MTSNESRRRRLAHEVALMMRGLAALVVPGVSLEVLGEADYQSELSRNQQLRDSPPEVQEGHRRLSRETVVARIRYLRRNLLMSCAILCSAVVGAVVIHFTDLDSAYLGPRLLVGGSVFCFAWATLGRLGWAGQSWKGNSVVERLDARVFQLLYWLGTLLGISALL